MTRVLVTGGAGFIGSALIERLHGHEVLNIDARHGEDIRSVRTRLRIRSFNPQVAYHLAAVHFIPYCVQNPQETLDVNVMGTANILESLRQTDCQALVAASSAGIYGYSRYPFREDTEACPPNVYGESKLMTETMYERFARERLGTTAVTVVRPFNVIGPGDETEHVLPKLIKALRADAPVQLGNLTTRRDYVALDDAVNALELVTGTPGTFNIGTGIGTTVSELIAHLEDVSGKRLGLTSGVEPRTEGDLIADTLYLRQQGWVPRYTVAEAVARTWKE